MIEASSILYGFILAWLQRFPVKQMIDNGVTKSKSKEFHAVSFGARVVFALIVWCFTKHWQNGAISFLVSSVSFDLILNLMENHSIFYEGTTATTDSLWNKLGKYSGIMKTVAVSVAVFFLEKSIIHK